MLIADGEWMVRAMLRTILESAADITVVGEAADGAEAVSLTRVDPTRRGPNGHPDAPR